MAHMAPKKKHEFFGRGRGIADLSLYDQDQSDSGGSCSPRPSSYDASPSSSSTRQSSPTSTSSFDYSHTPLSSPPPPIPSHAYAAQPIYQPSSYRDYHQPFGIGPSHYPPEMPDPTAHFGGSGVGSAYPSHFSPSGPSHKLIGAEGGEGYNGEIAPPYAIEDDGEDPQNPGMKGKSSGGKPKKRAQRCRMCANHNVIVDMKGHKWSCPYRECNCSSCDITRKTQFYMKERQKLTRHQQIQQQQEERGLGTQGPLSEGSVRRVAVDQTQMNFPRVDEMVKETEDILDYNLFDKVNEACRSRIGP